MSRKLSGLQAWVIQRVSAVYIAMFIVAASLSLLVNGPPENYQAWKHLWATPLFNLATSLFIAALLLHAWVGIRDIVLDYIHPPALRFIVLSLLIGALLGCALWSARILIHVF